MSTPMPYYTAGCTTGWADVFS